MVKVKIAQTSFVSGELDPEMINRVDRSFYARATTKSRNVYILSQGGAKRREGLEYIDTVTNNDPDCRIIEFAFNVEQQYLLLFTPSELKVYKQDVLHQTITTGRMTDFTGPIIDEFNYTQTADTLIIVHPDLEPVQITRDPSEVFSATTYSFTNIPNFDFGSGPEAVISVARGWPVSVAFFRQRLWLGGTKSRPQTLLATVIGDYDNLNTGAATNAAIDFTIDDDRVNAIQNLFPAKTLQPYTSGGEFALTTLAGDDIQNDTVATQISKETLHGSTKTRPLSVDGNTIFIEAGGHHVRKFVYNDQENSYNAEKLSRLSTHLIRDPNRMSKRRATTGFPNDYVYLTNSDGTCAVLNVEKQEDLEAFSLFETNGEFRDVATLDDATYFITKRNVNGSDVRYIEKLQPTSFMDASIQDSIDVFTNTDFSTGISGWNDISTGTGAIAHNSVDQRLVLSGGAAGDGIAEQSLVVRNVEYKIRADVVGGDIAVNVGSASGLSDIASGTLIAGSGTTFLFTPPAGTAYISFSNPNNDSREIDDIKITIREWGGLSHLEGETVKIRGDGFILTDQTVSGGIITTAEDSTSVNIGLNFSAEVESLPIDLVISTGSSTFGDFKRLVYVNVRLHESRNIVIEVRGKKFRPLFRSFTNNQFSGDLPLFTGWKKIYLGSFDRDVTVKITQEEPLEFNVLGAHYGVGV